MKKINVVIWNEFRHEKTREKAKLLYPNGLHAAIKDYLDQCTDMEVTLAALDDPDQGLNEERLEQTDVLIWWGHMAHNEVSPALVKRIRDRVWEGKMGFIALHSSHMSLPFCAIVGTEGVLTCGRGQKEILWTLMPSHEICAGLPDHFLLETEELYAEPFYIPEPDELVLGAWFEDGHILRAGACFRRGAGKVFYFQPGHETCPSYYNPHVLRVIQNAVRWAKPAKEKPQVNRACVWMDRAIVDEFGQ